MSKLYQYSINNIVDINGWMVENNFNITSFNKIIVESVERVQLVADLNEALKERLILRLRFFNRDYDFNVLRNKKDRFNIIILTEKNLPYEEKQSYTIIETQDGINYCNYQNSSEFKIKKYICRPILVNKSKILSIPELLVFYRIYE